MDREHIIREIRRTASSDKVALGRSNFYKETGIKESDWIGIYWAKWSDAVLDADCTPSTLTTSINEDVLLEKIAGFIRELGHFPTHPELDLKGRSDDAFPSKRTFTRRFGRKGNFASVLYDWCLSNGEWADVANICEPLRVEEKIDEDAEPQVKENNGFVYLMRSGKHYKIGKTNSLDRRKYEIGLQMPERVVPIHSIATDDPSGIEAYWHSRFKEKRLNGEWFLLSKSDISAFKKRKFM